MILLKFPPNCMKPRIFGCLGVAGQVGGVGWHAISTTEISMCIIDFDIYDVHSKYIWLSHYLLR